MRTAVITVEVTVRNVPDHITDEQVINRLAGMAGAYSSLTWPEPRSFVEGVRVVTADKATQDTPAEV